MGRKRHLVFLKERNFYFFNKGWGGVEGGGESLIY